MKTDKKSEKETKAQVSRYTAIFASGTMASRVLGMVRDQLSGFLLPTASRDAFIFAFSLTNMLRDMLGEGAANAAFVPVFAESKQKDSEADYRRLVSAALSGMLVVFGVLTVLGLVLIPFIPTILEILRPITKAAPKSPEQLLFTVHLVEWTWPYLFLIGMAVFAMGPLFVAKQYTAPSWSPILLNIALIAACLALYKVTPDPAWSLVVGVWVGGIAQLWVMWRAMKRHVGVSKPNFQLGHPGLRKIMWLLIPVILGQATGEVNKLVDRFFAYSLPDGVVSAMFYANRLIQLPLATFGIAVSVAILPTMSSAAARKEDTHVREMLMHGLRQSFLLMAPSMLGMIVLGKPIVRLLFQYGYFGPEMTEMTGTALVYFATGLIPFAWIKVCLQGFYARQRTVLPMMVASASMFLNILLCITLVRPLGYRGLALATTISYTMNFLLLYVLLCEIYGRLWDRDFWMTLLRISLASVIMAAVAYGVCFRCERLLGIEGIVPRIFTVGAALGAACVTYMGLCHMMKIPEYQHLLKAVRRR